MNRSDGRKPEEIRKLLIDPFYLSTVKNSVMVTMGGTRVLCCASLEKTLPMWLRGQGKGWITAEYGMLPKSSPERIVRERRSVSGRTQEIQRLIGRSLRAAVKLEKLGERLIMVDCDVIQADGGTRTASVTGGFVALSILIDEMIKKGDISENPILQPVCAVSAGIVSDTVCIDLDYPEDSSALVDLNMVFTSSTELVEVQGTGEGRSFSSTELAKMIELGKQAVPSILSSQEQAISEYLKRGA